MTVELILAILTPLIVFGVTQLVKLLMPKLTGAGIVGFVVPLLSLIQSWVATAIKPDMSYWMLVLLGLLAVFVNELYKQFKQAVTPS
jgi:hypothetical protein